VSFPPEAKVCLHCGARLGGVPLIGGRIKKAQPIEVPDEELEPPGNGGLLRTGLGTVWIVLALVATCYRVCTG
jgi:hypothetical protein